MNVRLLVNTMKNQTWVPASAVERGSQGAYVYVVQSDSTVAMRAVTLGPQDGDHIAIVKGLNRARPSSPTAPTGLRDGADVIVPKGTKAGAAKPASAAGSDDARAARRAAMTKACGATSRNTAPISRASAACNACAITATI